MLTTQQIVFGIFVGQRERVLIDKRLVRHFFSLNDRLNLRGQAAGRNIIGELIVYYASPPRVRWGSAGMVSYNALICMLYPSEQPDGYNMQINAL